MVRFESLVDTSDAKLNREISSVGRALRLHRRCQEFESLISHHNTYNKGNTVKYKLNNRESVIEMNHCLEVLFYEDGEIVGRIEYPDHSREYVIIAATNWINKILTKQTVEEYTVQPDLFSR